MGDILLHYERVNPTSWAYLSSLLTIALFFKFNRLFCMRNLDLLGLILLAPGLLCIEQALRGQASELTERIGYVWLIGVHSLLLLRMVFDSSMVRRPLLEPNLSTGGLTFLGLSMLAFLTANVLTGQPGETDLYAVQRAEHLSHREASEIESSTLDTHGPGFSFLFLLPHISTRALAPELVDLEQSPVAEQPPVAEQAEGERSADGNEQTAGTPGSDQQAPVADEPAEASSTEAKEDAPAEGEAEAEGGDRIAPAADANAKPLEGTLTPADAQNATLAEQKPSVLSASLAFQNRGHVITARVMAILCQAMILLGILLIAHRHLDGLRHGLGPAVLYLLLPYTSLWTGNVTHLLPAALLVWAVLFYRHPLLSGIFIGLGCGAIYYPFSLLPLWAVYYWKRGFWRFLIGVVLTLGLLVTTLVFTSTDASMFLDRLQQMFGLRLPAMDRLSGVWEFWNGWYRVPILAVFVGLSFGFAVWPAQKNLATLMSGTAALMLGVQFWHAHSGGLALAWYLPLFLLVVFRPNLEDRVATNVVVPSRWARKT